MTIEDMIKQLTELEQTSEEEYETARDEIYAEEATGFVDDVEASSKWLKETLGISEIKTHKTLRVTGSTLSEAVFEYV